ncbi:MAG: tetratricopeptide repeat protein [Flavobacteriales bacterium]|jgi:tetratricopeptide (TPR) repeat protein
MKTIKLRSLGLFLGILTLSAAGQEPYALSDISRIYREGIELFGHEKYVPAKFRFEEFIALERDPKNALRINAEYYRGISALYLQHKDAEYILQRFVRDHPDSPWKQQVYFELGSFYHKSKNYRKALEWFEYVDVKELSPKDRTAFFFKRGQSSFEKGDYRGARQDFFEVKDSQSEYALAATYYYSHIAYEEKDFETALAGFRKLESDSRFSPVVPYYITQIYYKQKKYDELLAYAPAALDLATTSETRRGPEIARLIGDAYFIREKYAEALPYLEAYHTGMEKVAIAREDYYQLGFTYYRTGSFQKAIDAFSRSAGDQDELGQLSTYNVGDCYLRLGQKEYARSAFSSASAMAFNREVREDALFNYAKLAFELSYNPFHEAISAFEKYLAEYPDSPRRDEAYEFLLNVYMKTRNYEKALASLDLIRNKDNNVKEAYQIVAYNRGVELYQSAAYKKAEDFFDKVFTYPVNPQLTAEARFWKAEIAYNLGDYGKARDRYISFLTEAGGYAGPYYALGNYGLGYAYFKLASNEGIYEIAQGIYANANTAFRKYTESPAQKDTRKLHDAWLRVADCFFVTKSYSQAIEYYDRVANASQANKDYAMYQKAMAYGYNSQPEKKAWVLKNLLADMPNSKFEADAKYELARSYLATDRIEEARSYYQDILNKHTATNYAKRSLVDLCLIYVKQGDVAQVRETWNRLYITYPNDKALEDAVFIVRSTLIEDPEFQKQIRNMAILNVTDKDIEDDVFAKASDPAYAGNCALAIQKLEAYLRQFSQAYHAVEANYLLAECHFRAGQMDQALSRYSFVIAQPVNDYTEDALRTAATITFNKKDYAAALDHYERLEQTAVLKSNVLEGQVGLMRCHYFLGQKVEAAGYADKVISNSSTPDDIRTTAHLWRGRVRMDQKAYADALADLSQVTGKGGIQGAEAKYYTAFIYHDMQEYKKSETEIFQLIERFSAFEEWKYRSFLLLSDVYVGMKDYFQARATLEAILANVQESWVRTEADARIQALNALENPNRGNSGNQPIEIDLGN